MIIEELKPLVDRTYRTRTDRESTGIAGSSLGGLVSLHLGLHAPGGVRPRRGALAVGLVGSQSDPEDDSRGAIETEVAGVGGHGNR